LPPPFDKEPQLEASEPATCARFRALFGRMMMAGVVVAGAAVWIKELIGGKSDDDDDEKAPGDAS
jgi:hypothetical protein